MNKVVHDLASDPNPMNLYQIGQVMAYTVEALEQPMTNWLNLVADYKRVGENEQAAFRVRQNGIKAFIQAKGATTARSRVADKQIVIDTMTVSTRPAVNLNELRMGRVSMGDLAMEAAIARNNMKTAHVQSILQAAAVNWQPPFYGTGSGIVKATLNPMIQHWQRTGGVALLGDVTMIGQLAEQTGFTASTTTQQFSNDIITEFNKTGRIGTYMGANVIQMINPYGEDGVTPILDPKNLFILPVAASADQRTLKVVEQGGVIAVEHTGINDLTYEVRLDENFGAAVVVGNTPTLGLYRDATV